AALLFRASAGARDRRAGGPPPTRVAVQLRWMPHVKGAAIVLVVSFVALSALWTRPERRRRLFRTPVALRWLASLAGLAVFALVLYSGFDGTQVSSSNFSVTFVYVIFWVGVPVASVVLGDVFATLSPWRLCARAPDGLTFHVAGPSGDGMNLVEIWDSREQRERWM